MHTAEMPVSTHKRTQFVSITDNIAALVAEKGWTDGVLTVFSPHTTAGITINENADPDVARDMDSYLTKLIPQNAGFSHAEGNSDAHIKTSIIGSSAQVIVRRAKLCLGTWQGIYLCEFDGPRERKVFLAFASV